MLTRRDAGALAPESRAVATNATTSDLTCSGEAGILTVEGSHSQFEGQLSGTIVADSVIYAAGSHVDGNRDS